MRVLLITQGVSRLVGPLFESGHAVVGVLESMPRDYADARSKGLLFRILGCVYKLFRPAALNLRDYCGQKGVPYNFICKGRDAEAEAWVRALSPEIIVVFSMSQLLKPGLISIPEYGVINMHPSWLPAYRGPNPEFWQYYDLELNPGVTVHYIDAGEDTGDIIFQRRTSIELGEKSPEVLDRQIGEVGVPLVLDALDAIEQGCAPRMPQPRISPTPRARNLKAEDHAQVIDWSGWPVERVWHVLRGTESWLNAISQPRGLYCGHRWIVQGFERCRHASEVGVLLKRGGSYCVAARDGYIYLSRKFSFKKLVIGILQ